VLEISIRKVLHRPKRSYTVEILMCTIAEQIRFRRLWHTTELSIYRLDEESLCGCYAPGGPTP
jgi:hypothetical protein